MPSLLQPPWWLPGMLVWWLCCFQQQVASSQEAEPSRIHIGNMTCDFFVQPLNHFFVPKEKSPTYRQRYCVYNKFVHNLSTAPIFFYTGNESPLEQYINNTGLMWELAPEFQAQVIFMEHRYEGKSLPDASNNNCLSYSSSKQAIEDYARFLEQLLINSTVQNGVDHGTLRHRPVIVFGGSYGGMLAAWFRMKYPQLVTGAIAASAPIWGLPRTNPTLIDGAYQVIKRGLQMPYPPTDSKLPSQKKQQSVNHCAINLLSSWPLLKFLSHAVQEPNSPIRITTNKNDNNNDAKRESDDPPGLGKLTEWFRLCRPLEQVDELIEWARTPWFDMAEGSFPYAC